VAFAKIKFGFAKKLTAKPKFFNNKYYLKYATPLSKIF
jgi:hypothetical protein